MPLLFEGRRTRDVVLVEGVAAVDDHVVRAEQGHELIQDVLDDGGGHHQPDRARRGELIDEVLERARARDVIGDQGVHGVLVDVKDDRRVPVTHDALDEVRAHATEAHHT